MKYFYGASPRIEQKWHFFLVLGIVLLYIINHELAL